MARPLILALFDSRLRSLLATRLAMIGQMPIVCADHRDPALGEPLRREATLIIGEALIAANPRDWLETLRDQCWSGRIIVIVDELREAIGATAELAVVDRHAAAMSVPDLVQQWHAPDADAVSPRR